MMTSGCALAIWPNSVPMSPSRASARTLSDSIFTPVFSLGATSSSIACMIDGTPRHDDHVADPEAGRGRDLVEDELGAGGNSRHAQPRLVHLGAHRLEALVHDGVGARIDVDRDAERLGDAVGGDVVVGRP